MGELFRRFWLPALLPDELPSADCPPVRLRLLGEDLVAFRDSNGKLGVVEAHCPHRSASLVERGENRLSPRRKARQVRNNPIGNLKT